MIAEKCDAERPVLEERLIEIQMPVRHMKPLGWRSPPLSEPPSEGGIYSEANIEVSQLERLAYTRRVARDLAKTEEYQIAMKLRKKVEMLFAHLKRILVLNRLRLRGPYGANDEILRAATAQSLRKRAKIFSALPQVGCAPMPLCNQMLHSACAATMCATGETTAAIPTG